MSDVPALITQLAARLRAKNPTLDQAKALTAAVTALRSSADKGPMPQRTAIKAALASWDRLKRGAVSLARERRDTVDLATHAPWRENLHPRASNGRFGSGSGHSTGARIDYTRRTPKKATASRRTGSSSGGDWQSRVSGGARARSASEPTPAARPEPAPTPPTPEPPAPEPAARPPENAPGSVHGAVDLSEEQSDALREYTGNDYSTINGDLRSGNVTPFAQRRIDHMDAAFDAVPPLTEPITVQRGLFGDGPFPAAPPPMAAGAEFSDAAYSSTSTNLSALFRDDTMVDVRVPAGQRVLDINATSGSDYPDEHEILLPRGTRFRVVSDQPAGSDGPRRIVVEVVPS